MLSRLFITGVFLVAYCATAWAGDVRISVRTLKGEPVENAVVTISGPAKTSSLPGEGLTIVQKDLQFRPFVLVVPRGARVAFPNLDKTRHHVYSFSPAGPFELKLYAAGETRSVKFDKVGTIAIGCNIHDQMSAFIRVTDAPWAAVTDASGEAVIHNVEAGDRTLEVWHPLQKGGQDTVSSRALSVPATGAVAQTVEITVRKPLDTHAAY